MQSEWPSTVIEGFAPVERSRWNFTQVKLSPSPGDVALGP
jgi:hypothetical protein